MERRASSPVCRAGTRGSPSRIANDEQRKTNHQLMIQTLEWTQSGVVFIDQTKLPTEEVYVTCTTHQQVADAIRNMIVRGAPAIGVAAAMGIAIGVQKSKADNIGDLQTEFAGICENMGQTRPTAVNLFWAIRRMTEKFESLRSKNYSADSASADRGIAAHARRRHRREPSHGPSRSHAHARKRRRPDTLQRGSPCHRWLRHRARSNPRRRGSGQKDTRLCGRNASFSARLAP